MHSTTQHPASRTKQEFLEAIGKIWSRLTDKEIRLLRFHVKQSGVISAREAAAELGYDSHGPANLAYGRLAAKFCEIMGRYEADGEQSDCIYLLVDFGRRAKDGEIRWELRESFCEALIESGLISESSD